MCFFQVVPENADATVNPSATQIAKILISEVTIGKGPIHGSGLKVRSEGKRFGTETCSGTHGAKESFPYQASEETSFIHITRGHQPLEALRLAIEPYPSQLSDSWDFCREMRCG